MRNNAAYVNFTFYEKCATKYPRIKHVLRSNINLLPREAVAQCKINLKDVVLERRWDFGDESGRPNSQTGGNDLGKFYRLKRQLGTLRRYAVDSACMTFGKLVPSRSSGVLAQMALT